ncbi:MAG: cytochrome P450 [Myxococcales bacterium]|nr:cytochrome P450 [Myxococcales bacterium]
MQSAVDPSATHAQPLPGPPGLPIVGSIPDLVRKGRFAFILESWRRYGDIFSIPLIRLPVVDQSPWLSHVLAREHAPKELIVTCHPEAADQILRRRSDNYPKGRGYDAVRVLMGDGLVTATGESWRRERRLLQPAFRRPAIRDFLPTMERCTADMLATWERRYASGHAFDVYGEMMDLARRIIGLTMFGTDLGPSSSESAQAITVALEGMGRRMEGTVALPLSIPTPANRRFQRAIDLLNQIVFDIIGRARDGRLDSDEPNILQAMLAARDEESGAPMSDRQIRDEVITLYIAGHETTALTLTWSLDYLARYPEVRERVEAEIAATVRDSEAPTLEELDRMTYTRMVIDEVLRLRPPAWALAREAVAEDELLGRRIPAGAVVMFNIYAIHRHPEFWEGDPEAFDPDRFLPAKVEARHRGAHIPFIVGPRACIGKIFSIYETLLALARLLARYRFEPVDPAPIPFTAVATLRPSGPVMMRIRPR